MAESITHHGREDMAVGVSTLKKQNRAGSRVRRWTLVWYFPQQGCA